MNEQETLSALAELVRNGGAIVSDGECSEIEIANAKASGHHFTDDQGFGFVIRSAEWLASREVAYFTQATEVQARKYKVRKCGGGAIAPDAKYFVMRYDAQAAHGAAARAALLEYAALIAKDCPDLAMNLLNDPELKDAPERAVRVRSMALRMRNA